MGGMYLDTPFIWGGKYIYNSIFIGIYINKKTNKGGILNPLIVSSIIIIGFLLYLI